MTTIASLRVKLEANTRAFRRGVSEATETVKRFSLRATAAATAAGVKESLGGGAPPRETQLNFFWAT